MHAASIVGVALFLVAASASAQPAAPDIEVRFCPERTARPYPLDSLRGVQGLLIQNVAIINRSAGPIEIDAVEIELREVGEVQDVRHFGAAALAAAARTGQALQAQGMMELVPFQFCDGRLLGEARLAERPVLPPGEALLLAQQVFAWRGSRDEARVTVRATSGGRQVGGSAGLRLDPTVSRTTMRWPLRGGPWTVGAGASFHTTHRWAVPEEFAIDILRVGADGRSFRGGGERNADFLAYGADVVAVADGSVARIVTGGTEDPPMMRAPDEAMPAYYARISERQLRNLAAGEAGFMGETVILDHGNGEYSVYAHLVPGSLRVRDGERVTAGQPIGRLGSSGNSTEPHLHFQVCDRPAAVACAGIVPNFTGIELPLADGLRPLQSGDLVTVPEPGR